MIINLITNEKISIKSDTAFCDNVEIKNITDELNKLANTKLLGRKGKNHISHKIHSSNVYTAGNMISYLTKIYKTFKEKNSVYLIVSLSPYTFLASIILKLFKKKLLIYLRSDGFKEYKHIIGGLGPFVYNLIFFLATKNSKLVSCGKEILKNKVGEVVTPSSLSQKWNENKTPANFKNIKMLYVGRWRVEKGIFNFVKILEGINQELRLTIIGDDNRKQNKSLDNKISYKGIISNEDELIQNYDDHNILVLPSFTEGYSMVIDEALIRLRPVIIFEDIEHIVGSRKGVFVCKRNTEDLMKKINYISNNYEKILSEIEKNKFVYKHEFIEKIFNKLKSL